MMTDEKPKAASTESEAASKSQTSNPSTTDKTSRPSLAGAKLKVTTVHRILPDRSDHEMNINVQEISRALGSIFRKDR